MTQAPITSPADWSAPEPKINIIVEKSIQTSLRQLSGRVPGVNTIYETASVGGNHTGLSFTQPGLDLIRWNTNTYWNDEGIFGNDSFDGVTYHAQFDIGNLGSRTLTAPIDSNVLGPKTKKTILTVSASYASRRSVPAEKIQEWIYIIDKSLVADPNYVPVDLFGNTLISVFRDSDGVRGKVFYDHACEIELPYNKKDILNATAGSIRMPYYNVESNYNFFVDSYEGALRTEGNLLENILPNMYAFLLVQQSQDDVIIKDDPSSIDDWFEKNVTLGGTMTDVMFAVNPQGEPYIPFQVLNRGYSPIGLAGTAGKNEIIKKSIQGQYFDKWTKAIKKYRYNQHGLLIDHNTPLAKKYRNLIAPISDLSLYTDYNDKRTSFPMCVDINFSTDVNTKMTQALKDSKLSSFFIKDVATDLFPRADASGLIDGTDRAVIPSNAARVYAWVTRNDNEPKFEHKIRSAADFGGRTVKVSLDNIRLDDSNAIVGGKQSPVEHPAGSGNWIHYLSEAQGPIPTDAPPFFIGDKIKIIDIDNFKNHLQNTYETLWGGAQAYTWTFSEATVNHSLGRTFATPAINGKNLSVRLIAYTMPGETKFYYSDRVDDQALLSPRGLIDPAFRWWNPQHQATSNPLRIAPLNNWILFSHTKRAAAAQEALLQNSGSFTMINTLLPPEIPNPQNFKMWDITTWAKNLSSFETLETGRALPQGGYDAGGRANVLAEEETLLLGAYSEEMSVANNSPSANFFRTLMVIIFSGKYSKLIQEKTRTFEQILDGRKAYSETVFYKIEKYRILDDGSVRGDPIQSFYLPNSNDIDVHRYIDTQVKYNKPYRYKVFAYQAVVGNKYKYSLDSVNYPLAEICVFTAPSIRLIEIPYFTFDSRIMDKPPVWPDVDIIQYNGIRDKALFFLKGNVGRYKMHPVAIEDNDQDEIEELRSSQDILDENLPIEYKSDDQARIFEVFKTTIKPQRYSDFNNYKLKEVQTDVFENPAKAATAAAFIDHIKPNIKYYYTFRTVDNHGHTSNPTPIYEVEIIDSGVAPVLISKIVPLRMEKEPAQVLSKSAKRYMYIRLAPQQLEINESLSNLLDSNFEPVQTLPQDIIDNGPVLGDATKTVWGNKYRIRLTSKKTGKKLDFKIRFEKKHIRPTNEGDVGG